MIQQVESNYTTEVNDTKTSASRAQDSSKAFYQLLQQNKDLVKAQSEDESADQSQTSVKSGVKQETMTTENALEYLKQKSQEMKEKIKNGETEEKVRIGSNEFTATEWDKLVDKIDKIVDDIKEQTKEQVEDQKDQKEKQELLKKQDIQNMQAQDSAVMSLINNL